MPDEKILVIDDSPTILKVVQLVLSKAGYRVYAAPDGEEGVRMAAELSPDLILLDFVMPRMNGYQVVRALNELPNFNLAGGDKVPVVLMSAKGEQVGERFVQVMGIVDYITKPFSPEAITAVVQHALEKFGAHARALREEAEAEEHNTPTSHLHGDLDGDESEDPEGGEDGEEGDSTPATVHAKNVFNAVSEARKETTEVSKNKDRPPAVSTPALTGQLALVPLAEVLELLARQRHWGRLVVERDTRPGVKVTVFFRDGKVDLALAEGLGEETLLGRYLIEEQALGRQDLDHFLQSRDPGPSTGAGAGTGRPLGEQLRLLDHISKDDLRQALARQAAERVYELLRWTDGHFAFWATHELPPLVADASLAMEVDGILLEGVRRVDEWHVIEREIDDFETVFLRNEEQVERMSARVGDTQLTREEYAVLELVNGKNSVRDIVRQARLSSFDVGKMLFRLLSIRLIRRRVAPVAV